MDGLYWFTDKFVLSINIVISPSHDKCKKNNIKCTKEA